MKFAAIAAACGVAVLVGTAAPGARAAEHSVTVDGKVFTVKGLVGIGRIPSNARDKFGETFGSGSAMTPDGRTWRRDGDSYQGSFFLLPDRGYNAVGTTEYKARLNKITVRFTPQPNGGPQTNVVATVADTFYLTDAAGVAMSGLDPEENGVRKAANGFPDMPQVRTGALALDPEGVVQLADGTLFISDEYGPYIYRFSPEGKMMSAIRPPDAFIPMRKGVQHFGSNNPGPGATAPTPPNPDTGRQNNQGFEGLALTPDGRKLVALLQSATRQDGGNAPATRQNTRVLVYDIANPAQPRLTAEHVVPLPVLKDAKGATIVAAQSEMLALSDTLFLVIARYSGNGSGLSGDTSLYRRVEILNLAGATNIAGTEFDGAKPVAPGGVVDAAVKPATLTSFIDLNDNTELARFGLHNGAPNDRNNLGEKWEALALMSALDPQNPDDYFLFVGNDNDFLTQDGFQVGAAYKAEGGADVDTMLQVYRVKIPALAPR